jgi:hypothetical protein
MFWIWFYLFFSRSIFKWYFNEICIKLWSLFNFAPMCPLFRE